MTTDNDDDAGISIIERAARKLSKAGQAAAAASFAPMAARVSSPAKPEVVFKTQSSTERQQRQSRRGEIDFSELQELGYIVPDSPATAIAEEFRLFKRQLLLKAFSRGPGSIRNGNLILVCSSQPNEGKTFCAINLALSMASERDLTVLLVDADFNKPQVLSTLGLEGGPGLIDVIADSNVDLSDCLIRTNIENLSVLPAGRQHHLTTELLASERMGAMIEEIAKRYADRVVIFDSPPALASSAAAVLALHVGQTLFVVEAEVTREPQLREALSIISSCENIHLLLNKTRFNTSGRKFGSYYGYGV